MKRGSCAAMAGLVALGALMVTTAVAQVHPVIWDSGGPQQVPPAPVPSTGQTTSYAPGDDGDLQLGVPWPYPRFADNGDGTVTDNLTGLIWLQDASCAELAGTDSSGKGDWATALSAAHALAEPACGLSDGSVAGDWRLPNIRELESLVAYGLDRPALSNAAGTAKWTEGDPFSGVHTLVFYWSSTHHNVFPWA